MNRDSSNRPAPRPIPDGVVLAEYMGDGWYRVGIGRARGPKVFNLSDAEARQLVTKLLAHGITPSPEAERVALTRELAEPELPGGRRRELEDRLRRLDAAAT